MWVEDLGRGARGSAGRGGDGAEVVAALEKSRSNSSLQLNHHALLATRHRNFERALLCDHKRHRGAEDQLGLGHAQLVALVDEEGIRRLKLCGSKGGGRREVERHVRTLARDIIVRACARVLMCV